MHSLDSVLLNSILVESGYIAKRKEYVTEFDEIPDGVQLQEGPRGGTFYETDDISSTQQLDDIQLSRSDLINVTSIQKFAQMTGGMHEDNTYIATVAEGTFSEVEGLSDTRVIYKRFPLDKDESHIERTVYDISNVLGWDIVPEVHPLNDRRWSGHIMRWVDNSGFGGKHCTNGELYDDPETWEDYDEDLVRGLMRMYLLDVILGNGDRHENNFVVDLQNNKPWLIDNGLAFRKLEEMADWTVQDAKNPFEFYNEDVIEQKVFQNRAAEHFTPMLREELDHVIRNSDKLLAVVSNLSNKDYVQNFSNMLQLIKIQKLDGNKRERDADRAYQRSRKLKEEFKNEVR